ncbi:MAG: hypothetical protein ACE5HE_14505, partial [Phycisphaerae bacterium]
PQFVRTWIVKRGRHRRTCTLGLSRRSGLLVRSEKCINTKHLAGRPVLDSSGEPGVSPDIDATTERPDGEGTHVGPDMRHVTQRRTMATRLLRRIPRRYVVTMCRILSSGHHAHPFARLAGSMTR